MVKIEASVTVDRPVATVWKFITDVSSYSKTDPDCLEARQTSAGPFGLGTTWQVRRSKTPKVQDFRVTGYEPNRRLSLEITSGPAKGTKAIESLENIEGKTRLTENADYKFSGFYKLFEPFMRGRMKEESEARVGTAKRILESEAQL